MARRKVSRKYDNKKNKWVDEVEYEDISKNILIEVVEGEKGNFEIINNMVSKPKVEPLSNNLDDDSEAYEDYMTSCCIGFPTHGIYHD